MDRVCLYSDDSYTPIGNGKRHAVVAGAAIALDRADVNKMLLEFEKKSGKGQIRDWHKSNESMRERYIDAVLDSELLRGRLFYMPFDSIYPADFWEARVQTISAQQLTSSPLVTEIAITRFTPRGSPVVRDFRSGKS